jgi:hypothetical protein
MQRIAKTTVIPHAMAPYVAPYSTVTGMIVPILMKNAVAARFESMINSLLKGRVAEDDRRRPNAGSFTAGDNGPKRESADTS